MAAVLLRYGLLVILATLLISSVKCDEIYEDILYEEDGEGQVVVDTFDPIPPMSNLIPVIGTFNPSQRLAQCKDLGEGTFPVFGNCSRYLECIRTEDLGYRRRIYECPIGLWFSLEYGRCGLRETEICPYGRLVPNPPRYMSADPFQRSLVPTQCTQPGQFPLPGCRGYYSCVRTPSGRLDRYTYDCLPGTLWDQNPLNDFCIPANKVVCNIPDAGTECLRECVAGDVRTCHYTFVVEQYATMSIFCKKCPFVQSDCDLPNCIPAGGVVKPIISINRVMPGPLIQVCKGDTLEIDVQNRLASGAVTIHWHGILQQNSPHMDGVPFMTQCPIHPGNNFLYRMTAAVSGTHMYHSHIGHQESDGLFGGIVIREPRTDEFGIAARYDEDTSQHRMLIWHWFSRAADTESIDTRFQSLRREGNGFIVNGKGVVNRIFNPENGNVIATPVEQYQVETGKRYRFRAIFNSALNCPVQVSIDGHRFDIIALDGRPISNQSSIVDSFFLSAGERIDFVPIPNYNVITSNRSFYVRIRGLMDCDDTKNGVHQYAILRYDGNLNAPVESPPTYTNAIRNGVGFNINQDLFNVNNYYIQARNVATARDANPVLDVPIAQTPNKTYYIDVRFNAYVDSENIRSVYPQLNNISWNNPTFPPLTQGENITSNTFCRPGTPTNCVNGFCACSQVLEANLHELVEVVLVDPVGSGIGHPFHLHGYAFRIVAMGQSTERITVDSVRAANEAGNIAKTFNGPLKDTVIVPSRGFVIFRIVASNPGYWLFHCHISEHMAQGMALVFKIGRQAEMIRAPSNFPRCGHFA